MNGAHVVDVADVVVGLVSMAVGGGAGAVGATLGGLT